jgi:hypothetical protein
MPKNSSILWGLAYISVCKSYTQVRWLGGVFVIEKLVYVIAWLDFIQLAGIDVLSGHKFVICNQKIWAGWN